ncbi:MAG: hypothetical protein HC818_07340 [Synechococcaceae cyanobacterium RM1_1_27]|nr:hypothetical protein [Synechococcaceae cyanobacterium RM1_1_27]
MASRPFTSPRRFIGDDLITTIAWTIITALIATSAGQGHHRPGSPCQQL